MRYKPVGWRHESYRHYLAAKYGYAGHKYWMVTRAHLPQYQLREIARVHGLEVALKAREEAIAEGLSAKQLAERYEVEYLRGRARGDEGYPPPVVEPLRMPRGEERPVDELVVRAAKIEALGRRAYEEKEQELETYLGDLRQQRERENEELLSISPTTDAFAYDQKFRDVRVLRNRVLVNEMLLTRLRNTKEAEGYAAFVPEEVKAGIGRIPAGQVRLGEYGVMPEGEVQHRITEYMARKFSPMRPVDTAEIPEGSGWQAERKWDGTRMMAVVGRDKARFINRRQVDKTRQFPELADIGKGVEGSAVFDGEVIVPWQKGESFRHLAQREHLKDSGRVSALSRAYPARYIAFDIVESGGRSTMALPLSERRLLLRRKIRQSNRLREVITASRDLTGFTRAQKAAGAEGIVFKDVDSPYRPGRQTREWRKLKFKKQADVVVMGYEQGRGKRSGLIGALRVSDAAGKVRGKVGTGFDAAENRRLRALLDAGKRPVVRIEYAKMGSQGAYREPVYVGLRSDITRKEAN